MQLEDHFKSLEERLVDPAFRIDSESVAALLADDFLEFGISGRGVRQSFDPCRIKERAAPESVFA
jgi:hypothetical protein